MTKKVKLMFIFGLFAAGSLWAFSFANNESCATCSGSKPCNACKTCKYCKHCSQNGGHCGVCKKQ